MKLEAGLRFGRGNAVEFLVMSADNRAVAIARDWELAKTYCDELNGLST